MRLVILGAGGYGKTIADLAEQSGRYEEIVFLDDRNPSAEGPCNAYRNYQNEKTEFYPAFGDNGIRIRWISEFEQNGVKVCSLIHPSAYVSKTAVIGEGTMVLPNASVGTNVRTGKGCIINMNAVIDHDCVLKDGVHICLGAVVKAGITINENTKIEAGRAIMKQ